MAHRDAIRECVCRGLATVHAFLDDEAGSRVAKGSFDHDVVDGCFRLRSIVADGDAFAGGEAVGFDHHLVATVADVGFGGIGLVEGL